MFDTHNYTKKIICFYQMDMDKVLRRMLGIYENNLFEIINFLNSYFKIF